MCFFAKARHETKPFGETSATKDSAMYFSTPNCVRMNKDCSVSCHPQILSNLLRKHTEEESDTLHKRGKTTEPWSVPPGREAAS